MQIVIDISDHLYNVIKNKQCTMVNLLTKAVESGTPLPKGHGRLKDENEIKRMIENANVNSEPSKTFAENIIRFAPTIIDADDLPDDDFRYGMERASEILKTIGKYRVESEDEE